MASIPVFDYEGKNPGGARVSGQVEAPTRAVATVRLRQEGIWIDALNEQGVTRGRSNTGATGIEAPSQVRWSALYGLAPVSAGAMGNFFEQLGGLYRAGLGMQTVVEDLAGRVTSFRLQGVLKDILPRIKAGQSLSSCLRSYPQIFPTTVCGMVHVGELSGNLDLVASDLADDYIGEQRVWWALLIPKAYFSVVLLLAVLVPSFPMVISAPDVKTGLVLWLVFAATHLLPWIGAFLVAYLLYRVIWYLPVSMRMREPIAFSMPVWAGLTRRSGMYRFFRGLEIAVRAGVEFPIAMEAAAQAAGNRIMVARLYEAAEKMRRGVSIEDALRQCGLLSQEFLGRMASAATGGTFDEALPRMADQMRHSRDMMVKGLRIGAIAAMYVISSAAVILSAALGYLAIYKNLFQRAGVEDMF